MSINTVKLTAQGITAPPLVSRQENPTTEFSTESCFLWLHDKNVALGMNMRGMVNHEYNRLLAEKGLSAHCIPGGENLEELGMDKTTPIVRPDLYLNACQTAMSDFTNSPFKGLNISTATFFELLHQENINHSANVRGQVNQRYNELLSEAGICGGKIPGDDLEQLGMDNKTSLRADIYAKAYAQVIANLKPTAPYSHNGPIQFLDTFQGITQFMGYADIFSAAQVCKLWNVFSKDPFIWQQFFIEEGIPFVENVGDQPRNYKQDFKILYPMTISLKMSERLFGKVPGEMPLISNVCFQKCFQVDPFEPGKLMMNTFEFVVIPYIFQRTASDEFPFVLNKDGDLTAPQESDWRGKTLQIPNTIVNLLALCSHPLAGKENMPVFDYCNDDVLKQCNTHPDKISVFFMRTCIADGTRNMPYPKQKLFVEDRGFEVIPLGPRILFDAVCMLTFGTCPDDRGPCWSYARTSDSIVVGNDVHQALIGGFAPGSGALFYDDYDAEDLGVVPGGPAEVPRLPALGALDLGKGH